MTQALSLLGELKARQGDAFREREWLNLYNLILTAQDGAQYTTLKTLLPEFTAKKNHLFVKK